MKLAPTASEHLDINTSSQRWKDWLSELRSTIDKDHSSRKAWLSDRNYWRRRRYAKEHRYENYPWPGGSELVMPLIDMTTDRLKAALTSFVANLTPPVTVLGATQEEMKRAPMIELMFEWLVRTGSPNFMREIFLGIDDLLECGRMVLKSLWCYESRTTPEILTRRRLPEKLKRWVSVGSADIAAQATALFGTEFQSNQSFRKNQKEIKRDIQVEMDLDEQEPRDQEAIIKIMKWLYEGAEGEISFKKRDVVENAPAIVAVAPEHLIVPAHTTSIEQAEHITHEMMLTEQEVRARAKDYGWNKELVEKRLKMGPVSQSGTKSWQEFFRTDDPEVRKKNSQLYRVYESCARMDIDRDGRDEKVVVLWFADFDEAPIKVQAYDRPSGKWPYHTCEFELNSRYWYEPRGVPEKLSDLDWEITAQHRAKLNRMTIANSPVFMYRMNRHINPENLRWIPGQMFPVMDPSDIAPMQVPNMDMSFEREESVLRTWAEQFLGATDFGLSNPLSSLTEPRTKYEIQQIQSSSHQSMSLRAILFQQMLGEVYEEFFDLWTVHGPNDVTIKVTGEEPIQISKEDLQGEYLFQVRAAIGEEDPSAKAQKAQQRLMMLTQLAANPQIMGEKYEINMGEAVVDWLEADDIRAARRIVRRRTEEEIQQMQQQAQAQQQAQGMLTGLQAAGAST